MGTYVENNLSRNEKVVYEAHYHWKIWIELKSILTLFIRPLIMTKTDEFVITNKRVIMNKQSNRVYRKSGISRKYRKSG